MFLMVTGGSLMPSTHAPCEVVWCLIIILLFDVTWNDVMWCGVV